MDQDRAFPPVSSGPPGPMWHVTITLSGSAVPAAEIRAALERLAHERPFLLSGRYASDRAEIRYWEEAGSLEQAAGLAQRLWEEHRGTAGLPSWEVVGLEVLDRQTFHVRGRGGDLDVRLAATADVSPFAEDRR